MAQLRTYRSRYTYMEPDPTLRFLRWLTYEDGYTIRDSDLWNYLGTPGQKADCVLDYLLGWLGEGDAAEYCPTYEDWLLTVIGIADQIRRGVLQRQRTQDNSDFTIAEILGATDGRVDLSVPLLDNDLGMDHPALSRAVYERCRARSLAGVDTAP